MPEFPPEEVTRRRQAWLAAEERLDKAPDNEHFEKAHRKAWFEYMATKSDGVERIPDELVSKRGWNGYYLAWALLDKRFLCGKSCSCSENVSPPFSILRKAMWV